MSEKPSTIIGVLLDELAKRRERLIERVEDIRSRIAAYSPARVIEGSEGKKGSIFPGTLIERFRERFDTIISEIAEKRPAILSTILEEIGRIREERISEIIEAERRRRRKRRRERRRRIIREIAERIKAEGEKEAIETETPEAIEEKPRAREGIQL